MLGLQPEAMGLFTGATVHEVAHVVGAGNAMGKAVADTAIIVKMIRVMMLVPVLFVIGYAVHRAAVSGAGDASRAKVQVPWFAVLFLVVIGFNSLGLLPGSVVGFINEFDTFLLTMAMAALGAETSIDKFRRAGAKPFVLALILYCWLVGAGYVMVSSLVPAMMG